MDKTRKIVFLSMMISMALVLSVIDSRIPILPALPGVKIGLANIISLVILRFYGFKDAIIVSIIRCFLTWFFHGSLIALVLSTSGGILSIFVMWLLFKGYPKYFSMMGISICGAVSHNIGQISMASIILQTSYVFSYLPYLLIAGVVSGYGIGFLGKYICNFIEKEKLLDSKWMPPSV